MDVKTKICPCGCGLSISIHENRCTTDSEYLEYKKIIKKCLPKMIRK